VVWLLIVLALLAGGPRSAAAETPPGFTLSGHGPGAALTLPARPGTLLPLTLIQTTLTPESVSLVLSPFFGDQGSVAGIRLIVDGIVLGAVPSPVKIDKGAKPMTLAVDEFPTAGAYTGALTVLATGKDPLTFKIVVKAPGPPGPASLEVMPKSVTLASSTRLWGWTKPMRTTVTLAEKTGVWPAEGITLHAETASEGFDYARHLSFRPNEASTEPGARESGKAWRPLTIEPGGVREVTLIASRSLPVGIHTATLRFRPRNGSDDQSQKLALTVRVSHAMIWPILVVGLALAVSFGLTKVIVALRQRADFAVNVHDRLPRWLTTMEPILPVVWARELLFEAETLNRNHWFTARSLIDARLAQAKSLLKVLDKAHQVRKEIEARGLPLFIHRRAMVDWDAVLSRADGAAVDEPSSDPLITALEAVRGWAAVDTLRDKYWASLRDVIHRRCAEVQPESVKKPEAKTAIKTRRDDLRATLDTTPASLQELVSIEEQYARLTMLWFRREAPEIQELLALSSGPIDPLFDAADAHVTTRLTAGAAVRRSGSLGTPKAWQPLTFRLVPADAGLSDTYLFQHGLRFHWSFEQTWRKPGVTRVTTLEFRGESSEPRVVAFADRACTLTVSVEVWHKGAKLGGIAVDPHTLSVEESDDVKFTRGFRGVEVWSAALAGIVALVTGLWYFYAKDKTVFGELKDYLGLFAWGVGVDQSKNLLQYLQSFGLWSKPTST
jgi:hypothetical protein